MLSVDSPIQADPYRVHMRVLALVILIVFVLLGKTCIQHGAFKAASENAGKVQGCDFTAYYSAGELARTGKDTGKNIYDYRASSTPFRPYIYPPMFAVFPMAPLSLLSHDSACAVFYILNVLLLWGGMALLYCGFRIADCGLATHAESLWRRAEIGAFLTIAICWRYLDDNLKVGNANLYIFFLLAAALYFLSKDVAQTNPQSAPCGSSKGGNSQLFSGLSVALATTFKITPGLFGLYFLWSFRRWAMAGGALGLVLFLLILPAFVLGFQENWNDLKAFASSVREKTMSEEDDAAQPKNDILVGRPKKPPTGDLPRAVGISIRGTVMKLLAPTMALSRDNDGKGNINIVNLEPAQAQTVANVLSLVLLLITVAVTFPAWTRDGVFPVALSWSLLTVAMLLIAPMTRIAHAVVLLIPVGVLIACVQREIVSGAVRKLAIGSLAVIFFGNILASSGIIGKHYSEIVHAAGLDTATLLFLYAALLVALLGTKNKSSSQA